MFAVPVARRARSFAEVTHIDIVVPAFNRTQFLRLTLVVVILEQLMELLVVQLKLYLTKKTLEQVVQTK